MPAWCFEHPKGQYGEYSTPYLGMPQVIKPDGLYRWHVMDPIRFKEDLRVTIQMLGWRSASPHAKPFEEWRCLTLQDDIASTAFWYQTEPYAAFPTLPDADYLEVI